LIHIGFPVGNYLAAHCLERFLLFPAITPILVNPGIASVLFVPAVTRILLNPGIASVLFIPAITRILLNPGIASVLFVPAVAWVLFVRIPIVLVFSTVLATTTAMLISCGGRGRRLTRGCDGFCLARLNRRIVGCASGTARFQRTRL
jgi:hypothetical protein